jgi:hypothetical protein
MDTPKEVIVCFTLGIGDLVFGEPGQRLLLESGIKKVHLFARSDGLKLYHAYPGIQTHPLEASATLRGLQTQYPFCQLNSQTHPIYNYTNRVSVFTNTITTSIGLPKPTQYYAPSLPVSEENVQWAKLYANKAPDQKLIIWQMDASRPYKTLPIAKSLTAIKRLSENGYRVLAIANNHNLLPRLQHVKWMRGVSIERFMGLCSIADRVVAHDSAPAWIGAAVGAEVMAIFGPTNPQQYAIRAENVKVLRWMVEDRCYQCGSGCNDIRCLSEIPDDVLYAAASEGLLPEQKMPEKSDWEQYTTAALLLMAGTDAERTAITVASLLSQRYRHFELVIGETKGSGIYESVLQARLDAEDRLKIIRMPDGTLPALGKRWLAQYADAADYLHTFTVEPGDIWQPDELGRRVYSRLRGE